MSKAVNKQRVGPVFMYKPRGPVSISRLGYVEKVQCVLFDKLANKSWHITRELCCQAHFKKLGNEQSQKKKRIKG